jgi:hypothetical protein
MGICIAYLGKLRSPDLVPELIADLRARAEAAGWGYMEMEELVREGRVSCEGLQGLSLFPHRECEPLRLHFDEEGVFVNHAYQSMRQPGSKMGQMMRDALVESASLSRKLAAQAKDDAPKGAGPSVSVVALPEDFGSSKFVEEGRRYNWTKTQFAGPDVHIAVCAVLRHVKERYAPDLEIVDDTGYFDHGDRDKLCGQMGVVERLVGLAGAAFQSVAGSKTPPTSMGDLLGRVNEELASAKDKLH